MSLLIPSLISRLFYFSLLQAASRLPLFDASPLLVPVHTFFRPLLRWDAFHALHNASEGYVYEHEWAFFPGVPLILRSLSSVLPSSPPSNLLLAGLLAALTCESSRTLYALSLHHLSSHELALLASLLALIPTSPVTLYFAPYNEPFFTYLSYRGMLCCARQQWFLASLFFSLTGAFRANGIFLGGFILWGLLVRPFLDGKMPSSRTLLKSTLLTALVLGPFVIYNLRAYTFFCFGGPSTPEWCTRIPPSIYTHVQKKYWNNGFLHYWTLAQLPNFIISAPTILLISAFSLHHLKGQMTRFKFMSTHRKASLKPEQDFSNPTITPHVIHALIFMSILVFASHTQIILRLAASMPVVYWAAAWLLVEHPKLGRAWVTWSVLWSMVSTVLWAAFLPPA